MKAIVLGMGQQGKAVIHDLEQSEMITRIFAADLLPFGARHSQYQFGTKRDVVAADLQDQFRTVAEASARQVRRRVRTEPV